MNGWLGYPGLLLCCTHVLFKANTTSPTCTHHVAAPDPPLLYAPLSSVAAAPRCLFPLHTHSAPLRSPLPPPTPPRVPPLSFPALGLALLDNVVALFPGHTAKVVAKGKALRTHLDALLAAKESTGIPTIIISPTLPRPAPMHDAVMFSPKDPACSFLKSVGNVGIYNVMELPATNVPLHTH